MFILPVLSACEPGNAGTRPYEELRERLLPGWRVVGTVHVRSPVLNKWGFTEIRFVETVKTKKR